MPRGQPDFGVYAVKETVSGLADLGELAARLGSIHTFDRRGDVIWFDDFEDGISKWHEQGVGTDHSANMSSEAARSGAFSGKITTGNGIGDTGQLIVYKPFPILSKIGVEISFTVNTNLTYEWFELVVYGAVKTYRASILYYDTEGELYYENSAGGSTLLATSIDLRSLTYLFHTIKIVLDPQNEKYVRVLLNNNVYDMSIISCRATGNGVSPCLTVQVLTRTKVASNQSIYVDDVIVTQNEP